jgi:hypothetical protein
MRRASSYGFSEKVIVSNKLPAFIMTGYEREEHLQSNSRQYRPYYAGRILHLTANTIQLLKCETPAWTKAGFRLKSFAPFCKRRCSNGWAEIRWAEIVKTGRRENEPPSGTTRKTSCSPPTLQRRRTALAGPVPDPRARSASSAKEDTGAEGISNERRVLLSCHHLAPPELLLALRSRICRIRCRF